MAPVAFHASNGSTALAPASSFAVPLRRPGIYADVHGEDADHCARCQFECAAYFTICGIGAAGAGVLCPPCGTAIGIGCGLELAGCSGNCMLPGNRCCPVFCGLGTCCSTNEHCMSQDDPDYAGLGGCCPASRSICNGICCPAGLECNQGQCCAPGRVICSGACCDAGITSCNQGTCCPAAQVVCKGVCCGPGEVCTNNGQCCNPGNVCGNTCCGNLFGGCNDGQICCPLDSKPCAGNCCAPGAVCVNGNCCFIDPTTQACAADCPAAADGTPQGLCTWWQNTGPAVCCPYDRCCNGKCCLHDNDVCCSDTGGRHDSAEPAWCNSVDLCIG